MVWGAICYDGKLPLVFIEGNRNFDGAYYRERILGEVLRPWTNENFEERFWVFQQVFYFKNFFLLFFWLLFKDGSPLHTANETQNWLARFTPDFISKNEWPARSPDLNPMDYSIWSILEDRVCTVPHLTVENLKETLLDAWNNLDQEMIKRIVDDFPRRINACIQVNGKHFEWIIF